MPPVAAPGCTDGGGFNLSLLSCSPGCPTDIADKDNCGVVNDNRIFEIRGVGGERAIRSMPRFYFDLMEDGVSVSDQDGVVVAELAEAERGAAQAVVEMAADFKPNVSRHDLQVLIRDQDHTLISCVCLTLSLGRL
jgi:hypothetical protein